MWFEIDKEEWENCREIIETIPCSVHRWRAIELLGKEVVELTERQNGWLYFPDEGLVWRGRGIRKKRQSKQ